MTGYAVKIWRWSTAVPGHEVLILYGGECKSEANRLAVRVTDLLERRGFSMNDKGQFVKDDIVFLVGFDYDEPGDEDPMYEPHYCSFEYMCQRFKLA